MKQFNREVGATGEEIAASFLVKKAYRILEKNYSTKFGEIDLICSHSTSSGHEVLCFVEVKLKRGDFFGTPEEMIGTTKLGKVQRMAEFYLMDKPEMAKRYDSFSIDAVCIVLGENEELERINYYENIGFE